MKKYLAYLFGVLVIGTYIWIIVLGNDPLQPAIAEKILRFHVLANSDSEEDQRVKEAVRDAVGVYLQPILASAGNLEETKDLVETHMETIVTIAENILRNEGFSYEVEARITTTDFPEKTYGPYTFPKGSYEALQIVIGEGEGQNWWCVLYPNMCFRGTVYEVVEQDAENALKEVLEPWEYADVFSSGKLKLRFKLLECWGK